MKENQNKYNEIDFARYHSGTMLPDEMHALEKAALEDPFLADALDGYAYSRDPEKELDEIRRHLDEKRKQKNVFPLFSLSHNTGWKIAAMLIVMAGAGYFFLFINSQKDHSLAVKQDVVKKENPAIIPPIKDDTISSEGNIAFEKAATEKDRNDHAKFSTPVVKPVQPVIRSSEREEKTTRKERNLSSESIPYKKQNTVAISVDKISPSDITLSDPKQKSLLLSSDTTALVSTPAMKYLEDSADAIAMNKKEQAQQKIFIRGSEPEEKDKKSLNEVVVVGYGTQKRKSITGAVQDGLEGKVSGVKVTSASPHPKEGTKKFDEYIKENAARILDSTGGKISANILLSFTLNKKGKPVHIKVLESSCKPCETEAIRLLKDGPDWIGKPGEPGTVRIQF